MMPSVTLLSSKLQSLRLRFALLMVLLAGLLLPSAARAQVSFTGTPPSVNFGSQAIGSPSAAKTLNFSISSGATVGSIAVLTQGAPNLDFGNAAGSTCTTKTYTTATNCTVNVTFTPKAAGLRMGAVVFFSGANNTGTVLANVPVYGVGTGAQIAYGPGTAIAISPTVNGEGLNNPTYLAVDGAGDLFIADTFNNRVVEVPTGGGAAIAISPTVSAPTLNTVGLDNPTGLAVDGVGDLFIADFDNNRVVEVPAGGGAATAIYPVVNGEGLLVPQGLAVDEAGDLFIGDYGNSRVVEVPAGGGAAIAIDPTVNGLKLNHPTSVSVDAAGDLFIMDFVNRRLVEAPAGGGAAIAIAPTVNGEALNFLGAASVDGAGDLFIVDSNNNRIVKVERSQPPAVNFSTATTVGMTDTVDGVQTVEVQNIGNENLVFAGVGFPVDFPVAAGDTGACTGSTSLSAGQQCNVPVTFTPQNVGALSEDVTLTDNTLNLSAATQSIAVSGTAAPAITATHFSVASTASVVAGVPFTITVTALSSSNQIVTSYSGTVGFTSSDAGFVNPGTLTLSSGTGQTSVTLETAGTQTITATDTTTSTLTGSGSFLVSMLSPGSVNVGSQAIGSPSAAKTLNFSISSGTTVGSIAVLTQGAPNLDFGNAAGSTCTASTYTTAANCTVNVIFKPTAAGLRMGAVVFFSGTGSTGQVLANVPVYGIGTGAQIAYGPGTATAIYGELSAVGLYYPIGLAVDGAGDLFIASTGGGSVVEVPAGGGTAIYIGPTVNGQGLDYAEGLAVDGAGDLFISDSANDRVVEVPAGGGATIAIDPTVNGEGLHWPEGLAVDGAGDLFIVDSYNFRVVEVPAGGGAATAIEPVVNGEGLGYSFSAAVDGAGDLFVVDQTHDRVVEVPAGGGAAIAIDPTVDGKGLYYPEGVAVDAAGDLFIGDLENDRVVEVPAGGGAAIAIEKLSLPEGLAVDGAGDLFIANSDSRVVEIQRSRPPALNFPTATAVGATDTSDGKRTVQVQNIGNQALTFTALSYPADFSVAAGDTGACTGSTSLSAGQECDLPVHFTPQNAGALSEKVTLTDNALNLTGAQQSIAVSGNGQEAPAALTSPAPGSVLPGSSVVFTWSAGIGPTAYQLWLGTTGVGSQDLYNSGVTKATNETVNIPTNGVTVFARLYFFISKKWQAIDYTYTEAGTLVPAAMTSPGQGSVLPGSSVPFIWSAGSGPTAYQLWMSETWIGGHDLYDSGITTATAETVSVPANGVTLYVRLSQRIDGLWHATDYTYTEAGTPAQAVITSPTKGSVLTGSSVPFTWSAGSGPTAYQLWMSETWIGGHDLYDSGITTATTETVSVPANGVTLYVRLSQRIDGLWQATDYTYTEAGTPAQAVITSPTKGSVLPGSSVAFIWLAGSGATAYRFMLGTTRVGSNDLYDSGKTTATTETVSVPTKGATVYARLLSCINRVWLATDYTYTEAAPAAMTFPTQGSVLPGSSVSFKWSVGIEPTAYQLWVSAAWIGGNDLYNSGITTATTETVTVPANGVTLYVRLSQRINGSWQATDYTYTEAGTQTLAVLNSPGPGGVLPGATVPFTWTPGGGPTSYQLWLGTTGVGSHDLYESVPMPGTSVTVNGLPANGVTVYARLYQFINRTWQSTDTTYTEAGTVELAAMSSPKPGTVLPGSSVVFTWTAGTGPTAYQLLLGTTGVGSHNLYNSGPTTATTETVNGLPTNGVTVYARLWSYINQKWQTIDYTYTAQ